MNRLNYKWIGCFVFLMGFVTNLFAENIESRSELRTLSIDDVYLQKWDEEHVQKKELDKHLYKIDSFSRLKEGQTQFEYYLLDEPIANEVYKTCLIYEYYESEMAVWLVNYSSQNKVIDSLEVFCNNAEGAWQTTASIDTVTKTLKLKKYDVYADPEIKTEQYKVLPSGKIEKINN